MDKTIGQAFLKRRYTHGNENRQGAEYHQPSGKFKRKPQYDTPIHPSEGLNLKD